MVAQTNMNPFFIKLFRRFKSTRAILTPQNSNFHSDYKNK